MIVKAIHASCENIHAVQKDVKTVKIPYLAIQR